MSQPSAQQSPRSACAAGSKPAAEFEIERLQTELTQARAELEDFTYSVSHDLRASLRHVRAYTELIDEELGPHAATEVLAHLHTVCQAAQKMTQQIEGLTELSRLGRRPLQCAVIELAPLLDNAISELHASLTARNIQWQVAGNMPLLRADPTLIKQVLTHLLSNAIKFTRNCAVAEIAVSCQIQNASHCAITVSDNGVGFNSRLANQLGHVFGRLHSAAEFEGLGMGLALSRKIIERHGGTLSLSGAPGQGCSVSFTLPLA